MTDEHNTRDLWGERGEGERWEHRYDAGQVLDWWRQAEGFLKPLFELADYSRNEALGMAITDMVWRVRAEVKRWEAEVKMRLDWNMRQGHLTPFGEALVPLMERAGIKEPQELLLRAGRHEEPHALEILLRHMYGPPTEPVSGYLLGWDEALGIEDSREEQITLSRTLMARYTSRSEQRCA